MSNTAVASCCNLHEHTVKDLDTQPKMPLARRVIGVDELSIKKGHT
jgi:hypothetical protein